MKTWKKQQRGERAVGWLAYLNDLENLLSLKSQITKVEDALDLEKLDRALAVRAAYKYQRTMAILKGLEGKSENEKVHTLAGVDIVSMSQSHIMYVAFQIYMKSINEPGEIKCPNLKAILENLARLFALSELQQDSASCYETGYLGQGSGSILLEAQK